MKKLFRSIVFVSVAALLFTGAGCTKGPSPEVIKALQPVTLEWWGVFDDQDTVGPVISAYTAQHPNVSIDYKMFRSDEYEAALLNAFAEDRGPDNPRHS